LGKSGNQNGGRAVLVLENAGACFSWMMTAVCLLCFLERVEKSWFHGTTEYIKYLYCISQRHLYSLFQWAGLEWTDMFSVCMFLFILI